MLMMTRMDRENTYSDLGLGLAGHLRREGAQRHRNGRCRP
jgi:hypothetical protein